MYKKNKAHQLPALISAIRDLPEKQRERLEQSWQAHFIVNSSVGSARTYFLSCIPINLHVPTYL